MRLIISILFIYLIKATGSPLYGQYNHSISSIKSYVKSIDSLWLLYEEEDLKYVTKADLIVSRNITDTLYISSLKNASGDTAYRVDYHSSNGKATDESYYLKNNEVVMAKQEFNNDSGKLQKIVFFEKGSPVQEDLAINNKTLHSKETSISQFIREFKNYKDFTTYKKEQLIKIAKKYLPDLLIVLDKYNPLDINIYTNGDSLRDYFFDLPAIVHEGYHTYVNTLNRNSGSFHYMLNDKLTILIEKLDYFPSNMIAAFGKGKLRNEDKFYRYVSTDNNELITQQRGILGLLEEYSAYFQELKACTASYYYLKANYSFDSTSLWINYLARLGSNLYAVNEFKIFISWYLEYAKQHKPAVFQKIIKNQAICHLFTYVERETDKLIKTFQTNRATIIHSIRLTLRRSEENKKKEFQKHLANMNFYIENLDYTNKLLQEPEYKILNLLR
jgi:hypothetical protein